MQTNTRTETAHAMRTIVLWITLLLLSPYASCVVRAQGGSGQPAMLARIKEYIAFPSSVFDIAASGSVDFTAAATTCRDHGGVLTADQNDAAHEAIFEKLMSVKEGPNRTVVTFLGADMMYSVNYGIGGNPKCVRGAASASLNCVYQWNLGIFADPTVDHLGINFYRGSMYNLPGSGSMNGYTPRFSHGYPSIGQVFVLAISRSPNFTDMYWLDAGGKLSGLSPTTGTLVVLVCEIQDGALLETTASPSTTQPPSWIQSHWYIPLIVMLIVVALLFVLIFVFCCLSKEVDPIFPVVLRERSHDRLYFVVTMNDVENFRGKNNGNYGVDPNCQGIEVNMGWTPINDFQEPQAEVKVIRKFPDEVHGDQEIATSSKGETTSFNKPIQKSLSLRKDPQPPSVEKEKPNVEKEDARDPPSSRRRSVRRSRLGKRISLSMSEVEVPLGEEIAEAKNDEQLQDASTTARRRSSVQLGDLDT